VTTLHSNNNNGNRLVLCWACIVTLKRTVSVGISWHIYYWMSAEFSLSFHLIYWWFLSCVTAINFWAVSWWVLLKYFSVFLHHQSPCRWRQFVSPKCLTTHILYTKWCKNPENNNLYQLCRRSRYRLLGVLYQRCF
jgi:hypothetical protein